MRKWLMFTKESLEFPDVFVVGVKYKIVEEGPEVYVCNGQVIYKNLEFDYYKTGEIVSTNFKDGTR